VGLVKDSPGDIAKDPRVLSLIILNRSFVGKASISSVVSSFWISSFCLRLGSTYSKPKFIIFTGFSFTLAFTNSF
jgi:hypothetical protein